MSPSESQLRAALSDGEGPGPDPEAIIGRALQIRVRQRERRVRVLAAVGAVVVVGGIGVGIAASGGGSHTSASRSNDMAASPAAVPAAAGHMPASSRTSAPLQAAGGAGGAGGANNGGSGATQSCPATPVSYALAGGGGTNQFGASQPLTSEPVSSLTFCSYDPSGTPPTYQGSRILEGTTAQQWIDAADAATVTSDPAFCLNARRVEILVVGAHGDALTPLSVTGGCDYAMITNGTAVRYVPISTLDGVIDGSQALATPPPSGMMSGAPPR